MTAERILMLYVAAERQRYNSYQISGLGLVAGSFNPADGLTKLSGNSAFSALINSEHDDTPVS